jgi:hypothetical protein
VCAVASSSALAGEDRCPNGTVRVAQASSYLPDCRAYELASPPGARPGVAQAAVYGEAVAWHSFYPPFGMAGQSGGNVYLSRRSESGAHWASVSLTPPQSPEASANLNCAPSMYLAPSLSRGVLSDGLESVSLPGDGHEGCVAHNDPPLVSEPSGWQSEPEGVQNLFLADLGEEGPAAWRLINRMRTGVAPANAWLEGASTQEPEELSHIVFEENAQLTEDAPLGEDLYEWANGSVRLVTFLPNGQPTVGKLANGLGASESDVYSAAAFTNAISHNGSRVFFTAEGSLYVRLHTEHEPQPGAVAAAECVSSEKACTIQLDASQAGGSGGGATFLTANATGTKVFFIDASSATLTSDTVAGSGENLYEYEVDTGRLIDLTGSETNVGVLGYSGFGEQADGTYDLYFVAEGALGTADAVVGRPNLFTVEGLGGIRQTRHIATLNAEEDKRDWGTIREAEGEVSSIELLTSRVAPDGRWIAFTSTETGALIGYDNTPAQPADCAQESTPNGTRSGLCREIVLSEAGKSAPICVSCNRDMAPTGPTVLDGPSSMQDRKGPGYLNRAVLDDGRVFFDSPEALVLEDGNGVGDVYEYHAGQVHLISSGAGTSSSLFRDASANGRDVFFTTDQRLLSGDATDSISLYDAREGGGFEEPVGGVGCEGDGCRNFTPRAPVFSDPASVTLAGSGNLVFNAPQASNKHKQLTRRQKLARALTACKRRKGRRARLACERQVRRRYSAKTYRRPHTHLHGGGAK